MDTVAMWIGYMAIIAFAMAGTVSMLNLVGWVCERWILSGWAWGAWHFGLLVLYRQRKKKSDVRRWHHLFWRRVERGWYLDGGYEVTMKPRNYDEEEDELNAAPAPETVEGEVEG